MRNEHESALEEALEDVPPEELEQVAHNTSRKLLTLVGIGVVCLSVLLRWSSSDVNTPPDR